MDKKDLDDISSDVKSTSSLDRKKCGYEKRCKYGMWCNTEHSESDDAHFRSTYKINKCLKSDCASSPEHSICKFYHNENERRFNKATTRR